MKNIYKCLKDYIFFIEMFSIDIWYWLILKIKELKKV